MLACLALLISFPKSLVGVRYAYFLAYYVMTDTRNKEYGV